MDRFGWGAGVRPPGDPWNDGLSGDRAAAGFRTWLSNEMAHPAWVTVVLTTLAQANRFHLAPAGGWMLSYRTVEVTDIPLAK